MDLKYTRLLLLITCIFLFAFIKIARSEGTKELRHTASDYADLDISSPGPTSFATAGCLEKYRLNIHISNVGETILFGFHLRAGSSTYTLYKPHNSGVALTGSCPSTGNGFILDYDHAVIGPYPASGGYSPLSYQVQSIADTGDYYIEFSNSPQFSEFDFQVVTGSNNPAIPSDALNGRVWSGAWQLYADLNTNPRQFFSGKIYIYSDDKIVTSCKFDHASVGLFSIFCNPYGCLNTGNFVDDRKSISTNTSTTFPGIAQYKVFLNNPDIIAYPDGVYGIMTGSPSIIPDPAFPLCSGKKNIVVSVNKAGNVEIIIDIPYGDPTYDVTIYATVSTGTNYIPWDGKDGHLGQVPDGTPLTITITYVNGLTNLPIWDQEQNPQGYVVTLERPINESMSNPKTYWDDSNIGGGSCPSGTNLSGCVPGTTGCHIWGGSGGGGGSDCHNKMINTWWYSASSSTATINIYQTGTPPPPNALPRYGCGPGVVNLTATVLDQEVVRWWDQPSGGILLFTGSPYAINLPTIGTYHFYAEAYNPTSTCTSETRTDVIAQVVEVPSPPTPSGAPFYTCGPGTVTLVTTNTNPGIRVDWYDDATPPFKLGSGNSYTTPVITATTNYHAETVEIGSPAGCSSATRTTFVAEVRVVPIVSNSTTSQTICSGESPTISLTSAPTGASFTWVASNSDGRVSGFTANGSGNLTSEVLNIITGESQAGIVTYVVTPNLNSCAGSSTIFYITVTPLPIPTITPQAIPVCVNAPITYSTEPGMTGYTWDALPDGIVSGGNTNQITVTWPTSGLKTVKVTYTDGFNCQPAAPSELTNITVNPLPNLVASPLTPLTVCSGNPVNVQFASTVSGTELSTTFNWTVNIPAAITPNPPIPGNIGLGDISNQLFNNSGVNIEDVVYTITPISNGCNSNPPTYPYTVKVNPRPAVVFPATPPNPQEVCSGSNTMIPVTLGSNVITPTVTYNWTAEAFDNLNNPTPLIGGFVTPNNGASIPGENLVSTLLTPGYVNYSVVATFTSNGVGCPGSQNIYTVNVGPSPTVVPSITSQAICSLTPSEQVNFTANVSPVTYEWHVSSSSGVANFITNGSTDFIPVQPAIAATGTVQGHVTYQITPSYSGGGSFTCPGGVSNSTILVNPLPVIPIITGGTGPGGGHTECENQPGVNYSVPLVTGHIYNWTLTGATSFTGQGTNAISVTWGPAGPATIQVTETDQLLTPNCSSTSAIYNVMLTNRPVPTLTPFNPPVGICQGQSAVYTTESGMSDYTWVIPSGGTVTNGGTSTSNTVTINWASSGIKTIYVNYKNSIGCFGLDPGASTTIEVYPLPNTTITAPPTPYCQDYPSLYPYSVPPDAGSTFTWTILPVSGRTITPGTVSSDIQVFWTSPGVFTISVSGTNNTTGCSATSSPLLPVTILAKPVVSLNTCFDLQTTLNAKPFLLKGGLPLGPRGKYTIDQLNGTPVTSFNPGALGVGTHTIYFTYTNNDGCIASDQKTVQILSSNAGFTCGTNYIDTRESPSKTYKTININGKCWMQENLRYGTSISFTTPQTDDCIFNRYCLSTDNADCSLYGGLYQWDELMQYDGADKAQGFCPPGWHVPNETEWNALIQFVSGNIGSGIAGSYLTDDASSALFKAKTAGIVYLNNTEAFSETTVKASLFWTSTYDATAKKAVTRGLNNLDPSVSIYAGSKADAFPVRCVKDL
ncbi:MAG: FISUMP domain-containing protein [Bacteroidales bacterium]|nr:FISUMP domain-containing protein [Bacteroidales bacterium]